MKNKLVSIASLMERSGVNFGTSGARGLVTAMTDRTCYCYVRGFLEALQFPPGQVGLGGDLRSSTGRILEACARAVRDCGHTPIHCGRLPSPALALFGLQKAIPTIMVTGSHIPDDRNGIKFCTAQGEITKAHEMAIRDAVVTLDEEIFDSQGNLVVAEELTTADALAQELYTKRFVEFFDPLVLQGMRIGLYQHSCVGRDLLEKIFMALGAEVVALGRSDSFIPVDTEAIRQTDYDLARKWAGEYNFHALVSADGDADRPLLSDENGNWLRGDVLGILAAQSLQIDALAVPVSCNTGVDLCGTFSAVQRTRIGSPFVIEGMEELQSQGYSRVAGYEANGGFLLQTALQEKDRKLPALPTRDVVLPVVAVLRQSLRLKKSIAELVKELPARFTASDRLQNFSAELGRLRVHDFGEGSLDSVSDRAQRWFGNFLPYAVKKMDKTDGLRLSFSNGEIVHLRPSGNAPELRCYTEASTEKRARDLLQSCLRVMESWRNTHGAL